MFSSRHRTQWVLLACEMSNSAGQRNGLKVAPQAATAAVDEPATGLSSVEHEAVADFFSNLEQSHVA